MKLIMTAALAALMLIPVGALGQEDAGVGKEDRDRPEKHDAVKEEALPEVVVTGSRTERTEMSTPRSIDRIGADEIRHFQAQSLPQIIEETAGVTVQATNRGAGAPIIRGLIGPDNLILIDGIRFNNSTYRTGPNQYLSLVDPWSAGRVEVLRGPGSVLYGSDAMGGVVNVITGSVAPEDQWRLGGLTAYRFQSADVSHSGALEGRVGSPYAGLLVGGSGSMFSTLRAGGGEDQLASDYDSYFMRTKLTVPLSKRWDFRLAYFGGRIADAGRTDRLGQGRLTYSDNSDNLGYVRATYKSPGLLSSLEVNLSLHRTGETVDSIRCGTNDAGILEDLRGCVAEDPDLVSKRQWNRDTVVTPGAFIVAELRPPLLDSKVVAGVEAYYDVVSSEMEEASGDSWEWKAKDRGNYSDGSTYLMLGAFSYVDFRIATLSPFEIRAHGGARVSHSGASAPDVPALGDLSYEDTGVVGAAGLAATVTDTLNLYFDFSQGFRSPNLQETTVLGDTGSNFELPNDGLDPTSANTFEVGTKVHAGPLRVALSGFYMKIDDAFAREEVPETEWASHGITAEDVKGLPVVRRVNALSSNYYGVDGEARAGFLNGFFARAAAAALRGETTNQDGSEEPALRVPPPTGLLGLGFTDKSGRFYVEGFLRGALQQDRLNAGDKKDLRICQDPTHPGVLLESCEGTPGWLTVNLRGFAEVVDGIRMEALLANITDENYRAHGSGFDAPGFNASFTLSGEF